MGSNTVSVKKEIEDQPDEDEIVSEVMRVSNFDFCVHFFALVK